MSKNVGVSVRRQCELLGISRTLAYSAPKGESEENFKIMREIDELHLEDASAGSRRICSYLRRRGWPKMSRGRDKRLMNLMGVEAVYSAQAHHDPRRAFRDLSLQT